MTSISTQCLVGPTTALVICHGKVISACGSEISVFDLATNRLEARTCVLRGSSIHGLREGQSTDDQILLCVFGGKQVCVASIELRPPQLRHCIRFKSQVLKATDWILDAHWVRDQDGSSCVSLALAHNSALLWDWQSNEIKEVRDCTEKCILYCARFFGNTWNNLMFAAGTVFNQVVLWPVGDVVQPNKNPSFQSTEPVSIMHTFSGHKGVIFSIRYHSELKRLCSVSDDRSIRMWQLDFPDDTGADPSITQWRGMKSHLMFSLYGHAARVWDVVLMATSFTSVGEDATCFVWDYHGKITQKFKGHKGKSIWSLAASGDEKYVVTGGGDASIRVWELQQARHLQTSSSVLPLQLLDPGDDFPRTVKLLNFDTGLIMMNFGSLYAYSVNEQKFQPIFFDPEFKSYSVVSPCLGKNICAIGSIKGTLRILFVKDNCHMNQAQVDVALFDGKILCLVWLDSTRLLCSGPDGQCCLLRVSTNQTSADDSSPTATVVQRLQLPPSKHRWMSGACCVSPQTGGPSSDTVDSGYLVCGDKDGSVFLYPYVDVGCVSSSATCIEPLQSFYRVHGKTGVTFVCEREGRIYTTGRDGFYREWEVQNGVLVQLHGHKVVKGMDWIDHLEWHNDNLHVYGFISSQFVVWSISHNQQLMSVQCGGGHRSWGCLAQDGALRFIYLKGGEVCMVDCGHQGKQSLLQPALHGREVCDVKFVPQQKGVAAPIVCTASEDTTINVGTFMEESGLIVWQPLAVIRGHLSSVRSLAVCSRGIHSQAKMSTDNTSRSDEKWCILFSGGGRAEIRASRLSTSNYAKAKASHSKNKNSRTSSLDPSSSQSDISCDNKVICANTDDSAPNSTTTQSSKELGSDTADLPWCRHEHLCTHFLGESRHKQTHGSWKTRKLRLDPETRVMAMGASPVCDLVALPDLGSGRVDAGSKSDALPHKSLLLDHFYSMYILSIAGSDGQLRVLSFNERTKKFATVASTFHHKSCVLKAMHYSHRTNRDQKLSFLLSASTRGDIVLWDLSALVSSHVAKKVLQPENEGQAESKDGEECEDEGDYVDFTRVASKECQETVGCEEDLRPVLCVTAHQSGVNSLHVLQLSESSALLASGGDDNALTVHKLEISGSAVTAVAKGTKIDAHAAQITGIWLVSPSLVVSASIDQRVSVWSIRVEQDHIKFDMVACKYIDIADVSCMDAFIDNNTVCLCIGGEGICLLKLDVNSEASDARRGLAL